MSKVVRDRLLEICPQKNLGILTMDEIKKSCNVAFKIIGYEPVNLDESIVKSDYTDDTMLWEFIYEVWRIDNESE